ncbi:MAG: DUF3343 domain-containing protein [Pleomorphochaeta sp.]|jgi:hypothetical protein
MNNFVLTFNTQLDAIITKRFCEKTNINCKLAPVPRCLSSSCGTCAFVKTENIDLLSSLEIEDIYFDENGEYIKYERS